MIQTAQRIETITEKNYIVNSNVKSDYLNQITYSFLVSRYFALSKVLFLKIWFQLILEIELLTMSKSKAEAIIKQIKNSGIKESVIFHPRIIKKAWSLCLHENHKREKNQFLTNNSWS